MNTHTPKHIIGIVVYTMAALSLIFFSTVSACAIWKIQVEPMYYTVGGGIVTGMLAMLVNTRSGPSEPSKMETITQIHELSPRPPGPNP